jgi:ubiquinone/menaquinone biosynthesis C-methylase UbiE
VASVSAIPLPDRSVDKVLCLSVFQYLDDREVGQALREFIRVLSPGGVIVLHVKNLSSLYWLTLRIVKRLKVLFRRGTRIEHLRSFRWYVNELTSLGCRVQDYNSFNLLAIDGMPKSVLSSIQRFELRHHGEPVFKAPFLRRHGAELKIKATVAGCFAPGRFDPPSVNR